MALARANYQCEVDGCGRRDGLEVHHKIPLEGGESRHNSPKNAQDNLRVLCRKHHEKAHHPNAGQPKIAEIPKEQLILEL
jgi:5-methylcytosine-specific restriction endonuclease McrA